MKAKEAIGTIFSSLRQGDSGTAVSLSDLASEGTEERRPGDALHVHNTAEGIYMGLERLIRRLYSSADRLIEPHLTQKTSTILPNLTTNPPSAIDHHHDQLIAHTHF